MRDTLTCAIIGHLVGDYLLQTDYIAKWKKIDWEICLFHCLLWTLSVMLFAGWLHRTPQSGLVFLVLMVTHFVQDHTNIVAWWMRLPWKSQAEFAQPPCAPWSIIVVDNVWHIVTIWAVWRWLI